jgi:DNA-binding winged helix-turn-helix (wHTH) protein
MDRSLRAPAGIEPVTYRFRDLRLKADGVLLRGETALELPAQELALLRALLARRGEVVSAGELSRALWGELRSSDHRLTECLASLRKILQPSDCIENVYRRGYRIIAIAERDGSLTAGSLPRLAILPFSAGYDVPEYLGLTVAEQTMEQLRSAHPAVVTMAARDSVHTLARRGLPGQEIGKVLDAELLLTGQLLATPGRHRLRAEMTRVEDGAALWVEDLIVERERVAELADELADRVTSRLHSGGVPIQAEAAPAAKKEPSQAQREAHDLYLRAHYEWRSMKRHHMQDAMGRLLRAIELDPAAIEPRMDLANLSMLQCIYGYLSPRNAAAAVHRAAEGIPELNEKAEALLPALGWVEFHFGRDARSALRMMARSEGLVYDPTHMRARNWLLLSRHRFGEALELMRATIQFDPYSPWLQATLAWALHLAGEREESVAQARKVMDSYADYDKALFFATMILGYNGEAAQAVEAAKALAERASHYDLAMAAHAYALACAGRAEESHNLLERLQWLSRERFVLNTLNAATHVALGEADAALAELSLANENRCPWFFQMLADPRLKPLHERPEFAALEASLAAMETDAARNGERSGPAN